MPPFKILIVEDEPLYAGQLEMLVAHLGHILVGKADNAKLALQLVHEHSPDLILMDINLKGEMDGIQTAQAIHHHKKHLPIIFITSMQDNATFDRAKATFPHDFITKPFSSKKLQRTIELIFNRMQQDALSPTSNTSSAPPKSFDNKDEVFIKAKNKLEKIVLSDILWIEVTNRDCNIHTSTKTIVVRITLTELMDKLKYEDLMQVHRSFIINTEKISSVNLSSNSITIQDTEIPISKTFKDNILQRLHII